MEIVEKLFMNSNVITNKFAESLGIKRHTLASLAKNGLIERVRNGVYKKNDEIYDDFSEISLKSHRVVFSFHTALYLHGLSDRVPHIYHISVPQGINSAFIKQKNDNIVIHYVNRKHFDLGLTNVETVFGSVVKCYDLERTICDVVKKRRSIDKQIFVDAIQGYFKRKDKNLARLVKYSTIFGIEDEIRKYSEVLL